jgi:hypothetical protein
VYLKILEKSSQRLNLLELPTLCRKFQSSDIGSELPTKRKVLIGNSKLNLKLQNLMEANAAQ